jgi:hypothetical protein
MDLQEFSETRASTRADAPPYSWVHRGLFSSSHGDSIVSNAGSRSFPRIKKSRWMPQNSLATTNSTAQPRLRSPTSTRSLIDLSASPIISARSLSPDAFGRLQMHNTPPSVAHVRPGSICSGARAEQHLSRALRAPRRRRTRRGSRPQRAKWICLANISNPKHRRKAVGSLVSGSILGVMLSTCELWINIPKRNWG